MVSIKMKALELSAKGQKLIQLYADMAENGYDRKDGSRVERAYNDFELRKFRNVCKEKIRSDEIRTVLDYGGGGSDWDAPDFDPDTGQTAKQFFDVAKVSTFEPARNKLEKPKSDCVICMDVLEHIFVADVPRVVEELFSLAEKLLIINVACYEAAALLPTGENAHITVRGADWWKGVIDAAAIHHAKVEVMLMCSTTFSSGVIYEPFRVVDWHSSTEFAINSKSLSFGPS